MICHQRQWFGTWEESFTSIFHTKNCRINIVLIFVVSEEGRIHIGVEKVIKERNQLLIELS